jgi:hypothetical protein
MVLIDHNSKWLSAQAIKGKSSHIVAKSLQYIIQFLPSIPTRLLSDNGREFIGPEFEECLEKYGIKHVLTTPYTPSSNGAVERVNRTIIQYLRMTLEDFTRWDEELPNVVIIYNHTLHSEIECSPCTYLLNRRHEIHGRLPIRQVEEFWKEGNPNYKPFQEGQLVALRKQMAGDLTINKFLPRYSGPYTVLKVNKNNVTYVIGNSKDLADYKVHHRQLRG